MTETDWHSDEDLLRKLVLPKGFPRNDRGLPDPRELGLSYRRIVERYLPRKGQPLNGAEEEVVITEGKLQIVPRRETFVDRAEARRRL